MEPRARLTLDQLREKVGDDVILEHILKRSVPFDTYSKISKKHSRQTAVELVKRTNLDFSSKNVIDYQSRMPSNAAAGVMLEFTIVNEFGEGLPYYSEGMFIMTIVKNEDDDLLFESVIFGVLDTDMNAWEIMDVDEFVTNVIKEVFTATLLEAESIAQTIAEAMISPLEFGIVTQTSYDVQTTIDILTHIGRERAQSNNEIEEIEYVAKTRALNSLIKGDKVKDLKRINLSEDVLQLEQSYNPEEGKEQIENVLF